MSAVRLMAVGDVMMGRGVANVIAEKGSNFIFARIQDTLADSDILFGALDSPVTVRAIPNTAKPKGFPKLCSGPEAIDALKSAGFSVMHIGTNHILDFGEEGLEETINLLEKKGIKHIGAGRNLQEARKPAIIERNDVKFGFLGYCLSYPADNKNAGCAPLKLEFITEDIRQLQGNVDHVIVSIHHGIEYSFYPYPEHINLNHTIIDAGADIILGHHPHVLQGHEQYKNGLVVYSLGNFVFDKDAKEVNLKTVPKLRIKLERDGVISKPGGRRFYESVALKFNLDKKSVKSVESIPIFINNECQPTLAEGREKDEIAEFFARISAELQDGKAPFFTELSRLYLEEDIDLLRRDMRKALYRIHRIRWHHIKKYFLYLWGGLNRHFHMGEENV